MSNQEEQTSAPADVAQASEPKVKKAREPRTDTLQAVLWKLFARNASFETICREVSEKRPQSKFSLDAAHQETHYNYYRAKYNMQAKKNGTEPTTSKGPFREPKAKVVKEPKVKAPKAEKTKQPVAA